MVINSRYIIHILLPLALILKGYNDIPSMVFPNSS